MSVQVPKRVAPACFDARGVRACECMVACHAPPARYPHCPIPSPNPFKRHRPSPPPPTHPPRTHPHPPECAAWPASPPEEKGRVP